MKSTRYRSGVEVAPSAAIAVTRARQLIRRGWKDGSGRNLADETVEATARGLSGTIWLHVGDIKSHAVNGYHVRRIEVRGFGYTVAPPEPA